MRNRGFFCCSNELRTKTIGELRGFFRLFSIGGKAMDLTVVRRSDAGLLLGVEMEFRTGGNGFGRVRRTDEREGEPPFVSFVFVTKKSHRIR